MSIALYAEPADLESRLRAVDEETASIGLRLVREARATDARGEPYVLRSYEGRDALDRPTVATRVVSAHAVVLALGPRGWGDDSDAPYEARASIELVDAGVLDLPADLTGDGVPDVVLTDEQGRLSVARLGPHGAVFATDNLKEPVHRLRRLGKVFALSGVVRWHEAPMFGWRRAVDFELLASWDGTRFDVRAPEVVAFHADRAASLSIDAPELTSAERAERMLRRAWHELSAGRDRSEVVVSIGSELEPIVGRANATRAVSWLDNTIPERVD